MRKSLLALLAVVALIAAFLWMRPHPRTENVGGRAQTAPSLPQLPKNPQTPAKFELTTEIRERAARNLEAQPQVPAKLREDWETELKLRGAEQDAKDMNQRMLTYQQDVELLAQATEVCNPRSADTSWIERAGARFGAERVKAPKSGFAAAVLMVSHLRASDCTSEVRAKAFAAETELQQSARIMSGHVLNFRNPKFTKEENSAIEGFGSFLKKFAEDEGPLHVILQEDDALLQKRFDSIPRDIWDFVANDPAFQTPFNFSMALGRFKTH